MSLVYAAFVILAAFAAGNMFQVNQTISAFAQSFVPDSTAPLSLKLGMGIIMFQPR